MTTARSGEVLKGLLGDPEIADTLAGAAAGDDALPSLTERVEIYLAAVHGPSPSYSAEQRAAARARILQAIAADLEEQAAEDLPEYQDSSVSVSESSSPHIRLWPRLIRALGQLTGGVAPLHAERVFGLAPQWRPAVAFVGIVMALGVAWTGVWLQTLRRMQSTLGACVVPATIGAPPPPFSHPMSKVNVIAARCISLLGFSYCFHSKLSSSWRRVRWV